MRKQILLVGFLGFLFFSLFEINLNSFGGSGNFSLYPKVFFMLIIFYYLAENKTRFRFIIYLLLISIFASTNFESKREVISMIFPILLLEVHFKNIFLFKNVSKTILMGVIISGTLFFFIISMSLARGYGGFGKNKYFETIKYIPDYVKSDYFSKAIIANTEVTWAYFHSVDAVDIVLDDPTQVKYGQTIFLKPLLVPIPRSIYPDKPESTILWYTRMGTPDFYLIGGSNPINITSELFLNFHLFYFIGLYFIFYLFNKLYLKLINSIQRNTLANNLLLLYVYTFLFSTFRGQGFDLLFISIILVLPFYFLIKLYFYLGKKKPVTK